MGGESAGFRVESGGCARIPPRFSPVTRSSRCCRLELVKEERFSGCASPASASNNKGTVRKGFSVSELRFAADEKSFSHHPFIVADACWRGASPSEPDVCTERGQGDPAFSTSVWNIPPASRTFLTQAEFVPLLLLTLADEAHFLQNLTYAMHEARARSLRTLFTPHGRPRSHPPAT